MVSSSVLLRAAWVCPIAVPPMADGWVHVDAGRVLGVGQGHDAPAADRVIDCGAAALLPGLVNAHAHLELSWLRGRVPPAPDFLTWVGRLMAERCDGEGADEARVAAAAARAVVEMQAGGTVAVGDTANALVSPAVLAEASMPAVVFHELLGFRDVDGRAAVEASLIRCAAVAREGVRVVPAAHAPYSVSPELFVALRDAVRRQSPPLTSIHVGESAAEVRLLDGGDGPWRERLVELGAWREHWTPPGRGPGDYLCDLGVIAPGTLVVHGLQLTDRELARIARAGATLVTCPRSNAWVGCGSPPLARFVDSGVRLAVGTDSLASAPDLNLFGELAEMRRLAPEIPARRLLHAATQGGADALGLGSELGAITTGRRAALIRVDIPHGAADPEEALVAGVTADRIRRLDVSSGGEAYG